MSYTRQRFYTNQTLKAEHLNNIEDGIIANETAINELRTYDFNVRAVNHRGYCTEAPENTIPAYILSKQKGFTYVECDVSFTSDGVCVLLHDSTIDRTSNGSGAISSMTYAQANQYDYGSWKSTKYAGTRLPTFDEFLLICKSIGLHPYIEIKDDANTTQEMINTIVAAVERFGMRGKVTYISFNPTYLSYVKTVDDAARLGYIVNTVNNAAITTANELKTEKNEVFLDAYQQTLKDANVALCINAHIPLEVWTVNSEEWFESMNPYISGVTSDSLNVGEELYKREMTYNYGSVEYEEVVTLTADDIRHGCSLVNTSPYYDVQTSRASYVDFDIPINSGYIYKFDFEATLPTVQMGVQCFNTNALARVAANAEINNNDRFDPGWQQNGAEIEIPKTHDNGRVRLTFRADENQSDVPDGMIISVRISRRVVY